MEGILKYQNKNYYSSFHYTDFKRNMKFFILIQEICLHFLPTKLLLHNQRLLSYIPRVLVELESIFVSWLSIFSLHLQFKYKIPDTSSYILILISQNSNKILWFRLILSVITRYPKFEHLNCSFFKEKIIIICYWEAIWISVWRKKSIFN